MESPSTVYAIDSDGNFLGGFGGGITLVDGMPTAVQAVLPSGAISVPSAPTDARAKFIGFTVADGAAVGGSWDYSTVPAVPDVQGFILAIKTAAGGPVQANLLSRQYPNLAPALQFGQWSDAVALFEDAKTTGVITADQYTAFQGLATAHHIPITLP